MESYTSEEMSFFLITTDHLTDKIWFRDDDDFRVAMNYVAIVSFAIGVNVLAFILMSNHVHFVLQCREEEARAFISEFKRRFSMRLHRKYGVKDFFRNNGVDSQSLGIEDESLERAIAYVLMNSVAANICLQPTDYPWGTGDTYFKMTRPKGRRIDSLSMKGRTRLLHSRDSVPGNMVVGENGYILPESYVPVSFVESLFRTPKRLNYFLINSSKARRRLENNSRSVSFKDQVISSAVPDLCHSLFRKSFQADLTTDEMATLVSEVRRRFSADLNQIARILGIEYSDVTRFLENF
ncbi:MAG: hypothetical protein IJK05_03085 [Bacteroidales bacterium]|nr:hypothetical protein [Bacteroidales bacterium]